MAATTSRKFNNPYSMDLTIHIVWIPYYKFAELNGKDFA